MRIFFGIIIIVVLGGIVSCKVALNKKQMGQLRQAVGYEKCHLISLLDSKITKALLIGMTKNEVATILGAPQNIDSKYVWMWTVKPNDLPDEEKKWELLSFNTSGYFIVFYNDKLISTLIKNTEGDPWEVMKSKTELSTEEIQKLLGKKIRD